MNYPPNAPPPDGYGGFGAPPPGSFGASPCGNFGASPGGYGQPPQAMPGMGPIGGPMVGSAPYGIDPVTGLPFSDKSKVIAGILQLLFGGFGVGRFYTGHTGMAIAQIAVTWLTCGAGALWPLIDGIMMLTGKVTDSEGRPLRNDM